MRPLAYYDSLGVAGPEMLASQCVQVDAAEIALMAERGVRVSHMPLSNCEVGGGIAPVPDMLARGLTVGLGSDGYVDDFFEIMRGAFLIHKANLRDPRVMPAQLVWQLATEGGARALKLDKVGRLDAGWQADLQLISLDTLPTPPAVHNLYEQLLLYRNHTHVRATLVAGQTRVQAGQVLGADMAALIAHTREAATELWKI
jgi:5-methylthioadenosine/S-adenosylhomocysteine deaminase